MSRVIRTLLVDDEPLAREGLRVRLAREDDIEIIGEAPDGISAVDAIVAHRPDLVFLDVQMPGLDGFEVVSRIASEHLPRIVFVTAYDTYAMRAFVVHALDYLLKPIAHRRLQEALRRVRSEIERDESVESCDRLRELLEKRDLGQSSTFESRAQDEAASEEPVYAVRLTVRDGERFVLVRTADIDWVESSANYLRLHVGKRTFQVRMTMSDIERRLDPVHFCRIHRSTIVNLNRVREIQLELHGEYQVMLDTGTALRLSRGYRDRLLP
jgi:two-component system LytT family response regulator